MSLSSVTSPIPNGNHETEQFSQDSNFTEEIDQQYSEEPALKLELDLALKKISKIELQLNVARKQALKLKYERDFLLDKVNQIQTFNEGEDTSSQFSVNTSSVPTRDINYSLNVKTITKSNEETTKLDKNKKRARKSGSGVRRAQAVPRGVDGQIILPVQIGILTVLSLGEIVYDRKTFHNERYLWPVGYTVQRTYQSVVHPDKVTVYKCSIIDGGSLPKFYIEAADREEPIIANTATGVWTTIIRLSNKIRKREHSNSASGPDYYGFSNPTIAMMIQSLPNANKCENYVWQEFEIVQPTNKSNNNKKQASSQSSQQPQSQNNHNFSPKSSQTPLLMSRNNSVDILRNMKNINQNKTIPSLLTDKISSEEDNIENGKNGDTNLPEKKVKVDDEYDLDDALDTEDSADSN